MPRFNSRSDNHLRSERFAIALLGVLLTFLLASTPSNAASGDARESVSLSTASGPLKIASDQLDKATQWPSAVEVKGESQPGFYAEPPSAGKLISLAIPPGDLTADLDLSLGGASRLIETAGGGIAVVAPAANLSKGQRKPAILEGLPSVAVAENERVIALLSAPSAIGENGQAISVSYGQIDGTSIRVLAPDSNGKRLVTVILTSTGTYSDGWISYGIEGEIFPEGSVSLEVGQHTEEGSCAFESSGTIAADEVGRTRQLALDPKQCTIVVESEATSETGMFAPLAAGPRRAHHANWQQDPVGIIVNLIRDWVTWTWNGNCVVSLVGAGHYTEVFSPTGWSKVQHNAFNQKDCAAAHKQSYVRFRGGQFFPACTGFQVETIYNSNIVQGYKNGTAGFFVNKVTGGPPCHHLLSWHSGHGNILV